ncbi:MAG: vanomycin resistance protein VanB, partial [Chloroflexi bacterium]
PPSNRRVEYSYRILERTPAPTQPLYIDDPSLPSGVIRQTDTARDGLRVEIYRTVYTNGEVRLRDTIPTTFQPWPNIFVRGTGR